MRSPSHCHIYKSPASDIIDSIVISAQGDIRNALINLHFSSLRGAPNLLTKHLENVQETKPSKKRKNHLQFKSLGRDESVTMMHALGRVFNPKCKCKNRKQNYFNVKLMKKFVKKIKIWGATAYFRNTELSKNI